MENVNIGIANLIIANKLNEAYFNDKLIVESKKVAFDFFDVIKKSPVLQLEFKVFDSIENAHIENDVLGSQFIEKAIKLFEIYTIEEINEERKKLNQFISESKSNLIVGTKAILYNSIDTLIIESLKIGLDVDIDKIHESFSFVLNHLKTPKISVVKPIISESIDDDVIEIAVEKFNEKYAVLNEDDKNLFQTLIKSTNNEKEIILEKYKSETLTILEGINEGSVKDNIAKAIQKIKEMVYNEKNVDDNIIGLYDLKKELI